MSIMTVLESVETFVLNEIQLVENKAASWWKEFEPVVEADFNQFVTVMKPVAFALVTGLAEAALEGPAKLSLVSTALLAVAKTQSVSATKTMADLLVQQIVTSLSLNKPN